MDQRERRVEVNGQPCRVWEQGSGPPVGFLAGFGGLFQWTPFLAALARHRRVIVPSLPGFPGATGHDLLDTHLDWLLATHDLLRGAGLDGADLIGASVGGALAADAAAVWPGLVRRLVLIAPLGLYDEAEPPTDAFALGPGAAPAMFCADAEAHRRHTARPAELDEGEHAILQFRASESAARLLWPVGDTRLAKRLPRLHSPTLLLWGEHDRMVPPSYARRFVALIPGPSTIKTIAGAGHLAEVDRPAETATAIEAFLD